MGRSRIFPTLGLGYAVRGRWRGRVPARSGGEAPQGFAVGGGAPTACFFWAWAERQAPVTAPSPPFLPGTVAPVRRDAAPERELRLARYETSVRGNAHHGRGAFRAPSDVAPMAPVPRGNAQAKQVALLRRRRIAPPVMPNPTIIIAQVEGSGTALVMKPSPITFRNPANDKA